MSAARRSGELNSFRALLVVTLRQEVRAIAPWVLLVSILSASSVLAYRWIFPEPADRAALSLSISANPALALIFGPARDLMSADGFNAWRAGMLGALLSGIMTALLVVRGSRADEDSGRAELVASGIIGRRARLLVPVTVAALAALALGVVSFLLTWAVGGGAASSLVLSADFTASALVFAALAALTAQLASEASSATSMAVGTMGALYTVRGCLDASGAPSWTQWLTPFGWLERSGPALENDPLPLLAALVLAGALLAVALVMTGRRDFGLGLVLLRPGRAAAPRLTIWSLPWRLHRGALAGWALAFVLLGLVMGAMSTSVGSVLADNPTISALIAAGRADTTVLSFAFITVIDELLGIIAAVMGAQIVLRLHAEESEHRLEPLLAGPVRRSHELAATVLVALVATGGAMLVSGVGIGLVNTVRSTEVTFGDAVAQGVCTIPAVWLLVGLATATVGTRPALRPLSWAGIVATFGITLLGPTFKLPEWAMSVSPMHHVPSVLAEDPSWTGLAVVSAIAAGLLVVGPLGFGRRDIG